MLNTIRQGCYDWPYRFVSDFYRICTYGEWTDIMSAILFTPMLDDGVTLLTPSKAFRFECIIGCISITDFSLSQLMVTRILQTGIQLWKIPFPCPENYMESKECELGAGLLSAVLATCAPRDPHVEDHSKREFPQESEIERSKELHHHHQHQSMHRHRTETFQGVANYPMPAAIGFPQPVLPPGVSRAPPSQSHYYIKPSQDRSVGCSAIFVLISQRLWILLLYLDLDVFFEC